MVNTTEAFEKIMAIFKAVAGGQPLQIWQDEIKQILWRLKETAIEEHQTDLRWQYLRGE